MSEIKQDSIPATPLEPAIPNCKPPCPPPCPPNPFPPVTPPPYPCPPPPPVPKRGMGGRFCPPPWFNPVPNPPIPPEGYDIPPLNPYTPGMTVEKQINYLYNNVNNLIEVFNKCNEKVFGAYEAVVNSAVCNDAYYSEITTEEGYFSDTQVAYKITHIPFIDRAGQPIYFELGLPYNSTVNDGETENCYNASRRVLADKLIPSTQSGEKWNGWVIYKGKPINRYDAKYPRLGENDGWYTFGVTENGFMKWYPSSVSIRTLQVEKVRNAMNCSGILINNGQISPSLFSPVYAQTIARTGVGMNYTTKERFIITVEGSEQTGCTEQQLAELFSKYCCDIAVQVAYSTSSFAMNKGTMEFTPATVDSDSYPTMPAVSGFWYITKRRHYRNALVKEIAEMTQLMGEQLWYDWINADSVDYVKERIVEVVNMINDEAINRENADIDLRSRVDALNSADIDHVTNEPLSVTKDAWYLFRKDGTKVELPIVTYNYDRLVAHLQTYDNFETSLNEEIQNRQAADDTLRGMITQTNNDLSTEIANRKAADEELKAMFTDPNSAIVQLIRQVETTLQANINTEATTRENEDNAIRALITAEEAARKAQDINLADSISTLRGEYETYVTNTDTEIDGLKTSVDNMNKTLGASITDLQSRMTTAETDIVNLKNSNAEIVNRVTAINAAVTALQSAFNTLETSFDNIKTAFSGLQEQFHTLSEEFDKLTSDYADITPDIKNLIENGPWLERVNIGGTSLSTNMRADINGVFFSKPGDGSGGTLAEVKVGEPTTDSSAVPLGFHDNSIAQAIADAHNYTDQQIGQLGGDVGNLYVKKSGDTMSGNLSMGESYVTMSNAPTLDTEAANKKYVDDKVAGVKAYADTQASTAEQNANSHADTEIAAALEQAKSYTDDKTANIDLSDYLPLGGGTMTGAMEVLAPTDNMNPATKKYVDDAVKDVPQGDFLPISGGTLTGNLTMSAYSTDEAIVDSRSLIFHTKEDGSSHIDMVAYEADDTKVMSFGTEDEAEHPVLRGVGEPIGDYDAINKGYLDKFISVDRDIFDTPIEVPSLPYTCPTAGIFTARNGNSDINFYLTINGSNSLTAFSSRGNGQAENILFNSGFVFCNKGDVVDYTPKQSAIIAKFFIPFKFSVKLMENAKVESVWGNMIPLQKARTYTAPSDGLYLVYVLPSSTNPTAIAYVSISNNTTAQVSANNNYGNTGSFPLKKGETITIEAYNDDNIIFSNFFPFDLTMLAKQFSPEKDDYYYITDAILPDNSSSQKTYPYPDGYNVNNCVIVSFTALINGEYYYSELLNYRLTSAGILYSISNDIFINKPARILLRKLTIENTVGISDPTILLPPTEVVEPEPEPTEPDIPVTPNLPSGTVANAMCYRGSNNNTNHVLLPYPTGFNKDNCEIVYNSSNRPALYAYSSDGTKYYLTSWPITQNGITASVTLTDNGVFIQGTNASQFFVKEEVYVPLRIK